jgi:hypothetical protein
MKPERALIRKALVAACAAGVTLVLGAAPVLAQTDIRDQSGLTATGESAGVSTKGSIPKLAGSIIQSMIQFMGVLFLVLMVYAGFLWMTAQGNEEKIKKAKNQITGAVIGLIIATGAYAITGYIIDSISNAQTAGDVSPPPDTGGGGP